MRFCILISSCSLSRFAARSVCLIRNRLAECDDVAWFWFSDISVGAVLVDAEGIVSSDRSKPLAKHASNSPLLFVMALCHMCVFRMRPTTKRFMVQQGATPKQKTVKNRNWMVTGTNDGFYVCNVLCLVFRLSLTRFTVMLP